MAYCFSLIFTIPVAVWITLSMVRYFTLRHTMLLIVPWCLIHVMHVTWCILFIATWRTYWLSGSNNVQSSHNVYLLYNKAYIFCCGELQAIGSQPNKNRVCVFIFILLYLVKGLYIISIFLKFLFIKHRYIYFSYLFNNVCLNISHQVCCIYHNFGGVLYTIISRYMYTYGIMNTG